MKLLLVSGGANVAIKDVENGILHALREAGHEVHFYALDVRIERSAEWLNFIWKRAGKPAPKYTHADVVYHAGLEILERALHFKVEGVLLISTMLLHPFAIERLGQAHIRTGVILTESPYDDVPQARIAAMVDVCWTNERTSVPVLRRANPCTYYLRHAYDPRVHRPLVDAAAEAEPNVAQGGDVVFVGTGFQERIDLLSEVDWTGIDFALYGTWDMLPSRHRLRKYLRGGVVSNATAAALYRQAKVGLNLYRTSIGFGPAAPRIAHAESLNPRAVELAACGVFQISDFRAEVREVFGDSVPTFTDPASLGERVRASLADASERTRCARASREAIAPETFAARAAQVTAQLQHAWQQRPIERSA